MYARARAHKVQVSALVCDIQN